MVRDSANRDDGTLAFSAEVWQEFTQRLLAKPAHPKLRSITSAPRVSAGTI
jgi:hypothetical protein